MYRMLLGMNGMILIGSLVSFYLGNNDRKKAEIYNNADVQGIIHLQSDLADIAQEREIIRLADRVVTFGNLAKPLESKLRSIEKENPYVMKQVEKYQKYKYREEGFTHSGKVFGILFLGLSTLLYKERHNIQE